MHLPGCRLAAVCLVACVAAACSDDDRQMGPMSPGMMNAQAGGVNGPGMSGGMGGTMFVASEFDFLAQMIPHHEEAVMAARMLDAGTARQEMRDFARTIIRTQSAEIEQMKAWLAAWYPGRDPRVSYQSVMRDLTGLRGDALDRAFLEDMIPHHMMAVMMSQHLLTARIERRAEVVRFATGIRDVQQAEIILMRRWLDAWW